MTDRLRNYADAANFVDSYHLLTEKSFTFLAQVYHM